MKKFFSLVLALVMALSLTTVAWGADPITTSEAFKTAITADEEHIVVTLGANVTYDVAAWDNNAMGGASTKSVTINGNGYTITFNQTNTDWNNIVTTNNAKLTINNATITNSGTGATSGPWNQHDLNFACPVELNKVNALNAMAFKNHATLNEVNITDDHTGSVYAIWIQPSVEGQTISLNKCTIDSTGAGDGRGIKIDNQYVDPADEKIVALNVSDTTFKTEAKSAILVKSTKGADITASNCDISGVVADSTNLVWIDDATAASANLVTVTGASAIVESDKGATMVAQLNGVKYTALAAAVAAAAGGDTVVLLANNTEAVVLPVGVALDAGSYSHAVTAPTNYQLLKDTNGVYYVVPAVTFGDKYDLYLADSGMNTALKLKAPTVAGLSFTEVAAKTNKDGSGNVAYIAANNGQYFVKTTNPTVADYAVTDAGKTTVLYYVTVAGTSAANFAYEESVSAFTNFSAYDKCGYVTGTPVAGKTYFQDSFGDVFMADAAGTVYNYLLNGKVVSGIYVGTPETHTFVFNGYQYDATLKTNVPTSALCTKCMMTTSSIYLYNKVPATYTIYETTGEGNDAYTVALPSATSVYVPSGTTTTDKVVESAQTFDAGIAMYVGMSVMAAAGSAVVLKKKED